MCLNGLPSILSPQSHECLPFERWRGERGAGVCGGLYQRLPVMGNIPSVTWHRVIKDSVVCL